MSSLQDALAKVREVFAAGTAGKRIIEESEDGPCWIVVLPQIHVARVFSSYDARAIAAGTCGEDGLLVALVDCAKSLDHATRELTLVYSLLALVAEKVPDAQDDCLKAAELSLDNMVVYKKRLDRLAKVLEVTP